jgi:transposase
MLMRTGRPIAPLSLRVEERETLERWARRPKSTQALAQRSRMVLECAAGQPNTAVAQKLGLTHQTVGKWRQRFVERRLDGLLDEPRPGAPRQVGDAQIERVVRLTLESTPADATYWSTRTMAKHSGLSQTMISRIWRAFGLQPHRVEGFKCKTRHSTSQTVLDQIAAHGLNKMTWGWASPSSPTPSGCRLRGFRA